MTRSLRADDADGLAADAGLHVLERVGVEDPVALFRHVAETRRDHDINFSRKQRRTSRGPASCGIEARGLEGRVTGVRRERHVLDPNFTRSPFARSMVTRESLTPLSH